MTKLIISVPPRDENPHINLSTLLVFTTRVHKRSQLRLLQRDAGAIKQLTQLRQNKSLALWTHSYKADTRRWSDALARDNTLVYEDVYKTKVSIRQPGGIRTRDRKTQHPSQDGSLTLEAPHLRTMEAVQWQEALQARKRQKKHVPDAKQEKRRCLGASNRSRTVDVSVATCMSKHVAQTKEERKDKLYEPDTEQASVHMCANKNK